jgi:hypothetical protein
MLHPPLSLSLDQFECLQLQQVRRQSKFVERLEVKLYGEQMIYSLKL